VEAWEFLSVLTWNFRWLEKHLLTSPTAPSALSWKGAFAAWRLSTSRFWTHRHHPVN